MIRLHDAIANQAAAALRAQLSPATQAELSRRRPTNLPAYEAYQTGYLLWRQRKTAMAAPYLRQAVALNASFARARTALAGCLAMMNTSSTEARELLAQAQKLDDSLAEIYAARGFMQIFHEHDWPGAEASQRQALALDPRCVNARHWLGVYLSTQGRLDEAKTALRQALALDPTMPTLLADLGQIHYFAGESQPAENYCRQALALDPHNSFATAYLRQLEQAPALPDKETLWQEIANGSSFFKVYLKVEPRFAPLHDDPRFQELLANINLSAK